MKGLARHVVPTVLIAAAFSFPVAALFEDGFGVVSAVPVGALVLCGLYGALTARGDKAYALAVAAVLAVALLAIMYFLAPAASSTDKTVQFVLVYMLFGIATAYALSIRIVSDYIPFSLMLLGGIATGLLILNPQEFQAGRLSFGENNPIWMARVVAWLGLGAFAMYLGNRQRYIQAAVLFLISVVGVVMTASRGPLLALLGACLIGFLSVRFRHKWALLIAVFAMLVCLVLMLDVMGMVDSSIWTLGSREDSTNIRAGLLSYTFDLLVRYPEGIGIGRFNYGDALFYPHNVWLEVFVEWGWLAGGVFLLATVVGVSGAMSGEGEHVFMKMLLVFELINASLSGDVTSPRFLYGMLILGVAQRLWLSRSRVQVSLGRSTEGRA